MTKMSQQKNDTNVSVK